MTTEQDARRDVIRLVTRLIDYGKGGSDATFDEMTLGQIADLMIETATGGAR